MRPLPKAQPQNKRRKPAQNQTPHRKVGRFLITQITALDAVEHGNRKLQAHITHFYCDKMRQNIALDFVKL